MEKDKQAIETMLQALRDGFIVDRKPRTFIYTSGVWVLGRTLKAAEEDAPLDPAPHVAWRPAHEDIILSAFGDGLRTVVVRPGIVYGGGRGIVSDLIKDARAAWCGQSGNRWPLSTCTTSGLYLKISAAESASNHSGRARDRHWRRSAQVRSDVRNVPIAEARKYASRCTAGSGCAAEGACHRMRPPRVIGSVARLVEEFCNYKQD